jgi:hypothetical protein
LILTFSQQNVQKLAALPIYFIPVQVPQVVIRAGIVTREDPVTVPVALKRQLYRYMNTEKDF